MIKRLLFLLLFFAPACLAQVPVSLSPVAKAQFISNTGAPFASGCVSTFQAGTTNPQASYVDSGGVTQNTNPIILDAGGRADIWLTSQNYKIQLKSSGGVNCASGSTIWTVDNVSGQFGLLSLANTWTAQQTFNQPIIITPTVNQIVTGTSPNQTTLNFPAPAGNVTLTYPNITTTMVGRATTDTMTGVKTFPSATLVTTNPTIGGVPNTNGPATYINLLNHNPTGTTLNTLTALNGALGDAIILGTSDFLNSVRPVLGITVAGAGIAGSATIQQSGIANCVFDAGNITGNYVNASTTTSGNCRDAGNTYPTLGQVIGRSLTSGGGAGTYSVLLYGPEFHSSPQSVVLAGAYTNATTTFSTVTGMAWNVLANANYSVSCKIYFSGSATTAGPKFQFLGPAAPTAAQLGVDGGTNATVYSNTFVTGFSTANTTLGVLGAAPVNFIGRVTLGLVNGATAGTVTLQAAANGAGTLTIFAGSYCTIQSQ